MVQKSVRIILIVAAVLTGILILYLFTLLLTSCRKIRRKRKDLENLSTIYVLPDPPQTLEMDPPPSPFVPSTPVYRTQQDPVYLVPYTALPETFDFSSPDVKLQGDYVILKDLGLLEHLQPSEQAMPYEKQLAYNPDYF